MLFSIFPEKSESTFATPLKFQNNAPGRRNAPVGNHWCNLTKSGSKMETSKQLNIFQCFQKTPDSENQVGGFNRKEEDRPTTSNVPHGRK